MDASSGDVTDAVVMVAVMCANVSALDVGDAPRFVAYEDPAPDAVRRPVTALAVAERLALPRETVRRRLAGLVAAGRCERRRGGFYVPQHVIANDRHLAAAQTNFAAVARLRRDIEAGSGPKWPAMRPPACRAASSPPLRLINRRVAEFSLDVVVPLARLAGGYDEAFVYLAIVEATGRCLVPEDPPAISAYILAQSLGLPYESARRRLKKLSQRGVIQARANGYWAEPTPGRVRELGSLAVLNYRALWRLFETLAADGVDLTSRV